MRRLIGTILSVVILVGLIGCTGRRPDSKNESNVPNDVSTTQAEEWFKEHYEEDILASDADETVIAILSGNKNPGAEQYTGVTLSLVQKTDGEYRVVEKKGADYITPLGFHIQCVKFGDAAVVFGTIGDSIFDIANDDRFPVDITEVRIKLRDGDPVSASLTNRAFVKLLDQTAFVTEIELINGDQTIKYSDYNSISDLYAE